MALELVGTHPEKPTMTVGFFENNLMLLHLEGTEPILRDSMNIGEVKRILANAGYSVTEHEIEAD